MSQRIIFSRTLAVGAASLLLSGLVCAMPIKSEQCAELIHAKAYEQAQVVCADAAREGDDAASMHMANMCQEGLGMKR